MFIKFINIYNNSLGLKTKGENSFIHIKPLVLDRAQKVLEFFFQLVPSSWQVCFWVLLEIILETQLQHSMHVVLILKIEMWLILWQAIVDSCLLLFHIAFVSRGRYIPQNTYLDTYLGIWHRYYIGPAEPQGTREMFAVLFEHLLSKSCKISRCFLSVWSKIPVVLKTFCRACFELTNIYVI